MSEYAVHFGTIAFAGGLFLAIILSLAIPPKHTKRVLSTIAAVTVVAALILYGMGYSASFLEAKSNPEMENPTVFTYFTYILLTVQTLFSMKTEDVSAVIDGKGSRNMKKVIFSAAMNLRAEGGGVPMAPRAVSNDGKLSICWAYGIPKWRTFFCLIPLVMAKHEGIKGFEVINCKECKLHMKEPVVLHADGEYCGDVTDVEFRCLPAKLKVMM